MKIHKLNARGFIGIKKGLGMDEISIDVSQVSGLVAFSGHNGAGKSTTMELFSPFRSFPSRPGALNNQVFLSDSFKDLSFEYGGDTYRTLVLMNPDSDRSEGYVWKNGESMVNGKVSEYDRYIEELMGSESLFYNSVFCAQNGQKLSDMRVGELKKLFVEFLRLDRLAGFEATAKQCVGVLSGMSGQIEKNISSMESALERYLGVKEKLIGEQKRKALIEREQTAIKGMVNSTKEEIKKLDGILSKNSVREEQISALSEELKELNVSINNDAYSYTKFIDDITETIEKKKIVLSGAIEVLSQKESIESAMGRVSSLEKEIAYRRREESEILEKINTIYAIEMKHNEEIDDLRGAIHTRKEDPLIKETEADLASIAQKKMDAMVKINQLESERKEAETTSALIAIDASIASNDRQIALLDKRPEGCSNDDCPFIRSAIQAKKETDGLAKKRSVIEKEIAENVKEISGKIDGLNHSMAELSTVQVALQDKLTATYRIIADDVKALETRLESAISEKNSIRKGIDLLAQSSSDCKDVIEKLIHDVTENMSLSARIDEVRAAEHLKDSTKARIAELLVELTEKKDAYEMFKEQSRSSVAKLEAKINEIKLLIDSSAPVKISEHKNNLEAMENRLTMVDTEIQSAVQSIAVLTGMLEEKEALLKKIDAAKKELTHVKKEASHWLYLQYGCGKNGLQALEIDGVAPLISHHANNLLNSSFGPNFSVKIITQDQDTGKETFDIMVIRQDGSEVSFKKLSGGEKVWILKSIRLAMTLISKEKSGRNFQTLLADEEDGPLDAEKSVSFIGLYRSIIEIGGFDTCVFISHNPDVVSMADHEIRFSGAGIEIL